MLATVHLPKSMGFAELDVTVQRSMQQCIECTRTRVNPNINYGLWVIMMSQCKFTDRSRHIAFVRDVGSGETVHVCGQGMYGNSQYISLSFAVNLKLPWKNSLLKNTVRLLHPNAGLIEKVGLTNDWPLIYYFLLIHIGG